MQCVRPAAPDIGNRIWPRSPTTCCRIGASRITAPAWVKGNRSASRVAMPFISAVLGVMPVRSRATARYECASRLVCSLEAESKVSRDPTFWRIPGNRNPPALRQSPNSHACSRRRFDPPHYGYRRIGSATRNGSILPPGSLPLFLLREQTCGSP